MAAYYNENDAYAAQWLRNLISAGHIAPGDVDDRSIVDVRADDLKGYTQCHFFAGIGGWSLALRLAGWGDDRPVWTGSCPCQPWSQARVWHNERSGDRDERDLWPAWLPLIEEAAPRKLFGEQVAGAKSTEWTRRMLKDLDALGYHVDHVEWRASEAGACQRRPRQWFFADACGSRRPRLAARGSSRVAGQGRWRGEADMRAVANAPFKPGDRWPQPLVRRLDDGIPARVDKLRAFGNAIIPREAAEFIRAYQECSELKGTAIP